MLPSSRLWPADVWPMNLARDVLGQGLRGHLGKPNLEAQTTHLESKSSLFSGLSVSKMRQGVGGREPSSADVWV